MLKRQTQQQRHPFVSPPLIFTGHIEKNILPAFAPIRRQTGAHPFRPLGQQKENHVRTLFHHCPGLRAPGICLLHKKIRRHTDTDMFAALNFIIAVFVLLQRIVKIIFNLVNPAAVLPALLVEKIHITVCAAFAFFHTAMPGIPNIMHYPSPAD